MKKARCVPTIVSAALSLAFPLHSVFSYLKKKKPLEEISSPTWRILRALGGKKKKKEKKERERERERGVFDKGNKNISVHSNIGTGWGV